MRLEIDLRTDAEGRPVGSVRNDAGPAADFFSDWLDLLRALEGCIDHVSAGTARPTRKERR